MKANSLLDPRFRYVPAAATDIRATWQRFGFDPRKNAERRSRLVERRSQPESAAIHPLVRKTAA
jgi:hypothetical protein